MKYPNFQANFKVSDLGLVEGNIKNKILWKLGRVEKALPGHHNEVRSTNLKLTMDC